MSQQKDQNLGRGVITGLIFGAILGLIGLAMDGGGFGKNFLFPLITGAIVGGLLGHVTDDLFIKNPVGAGAIVGAGCAVVFAILAVIIVKAGGHTVHTDGMVGRLMPHIILYGLLGALSGFLTQKMDEAGKQ